MSNPFEEQIDARIEKLIKDSYSKPDGNLERRRLLRLQEERHRYKNRVNEPYQVQIPEYFDNNDDFRGVLDPDNTDDSKYMTNQEDYSNTINELRRWNPKRLEEVKGMRTQVEAYLNKPYGTEKTPAVNSINGDTKIPELFIKVRSTENDSPELLNVADLVNHFHYKCMVEREIPVYPGQEDNGKYWSAENIIAINKMARIRLEPFVRAFINTFEMTPPNVRKVYAVKESNIGKGGPQQKTGPVNKHLNNAYAIGMHALSNTGYPNFPSQTQGIPGLQVGGNIKSSIGGANELFKELQNLSEGTNGMINNTYNLLNELKNEYGNMNQNGGKKTGSKKKNIKKGSKKK